MTQRKKDNEVIDLIHDINDEDNSFNDTFETDRKGIFINDNLFESSDQNNKKAITMVSDDIPKRKFIPKRCFI